MIKTVLFDLDGTLLPMDQEVFLKAYMGGLAKKMMPYGYDPQKLIPAVWTGTGAMVQNDGTQRNDVVFWKTFSDAMAVDVQKDLPVFEDFYRNEFQQVQNACGYTPQAAEVIRQLKEMGVMLILATNPLFPAIATHSRIRWAGLEPGDFALVTTYENSFHCKPNPDYYRDILKEVNCRPEECLMVGNDAGEDTIAAELGMQVFLLTECLINKDGRDISRYPQGGFSELMAYIMEGKR